jgi:hypothetical protein
VIAIENQFTEILPPVRNEWAIAFQANCRLLICPLAYREKTSNAITPARLVYGPVLRTPAISYF